MKHPKTVARVQRWIAAKKPGERFYAKNIAKTLNLTGADVGNILKWQENVRKTEDSRSNGTIWVRVSA